MPASITPTAHAAGNIRMPRWTLRSVAIANTATKIAIARIGGGDA
jgi:hypothetical protein